MDRKLMIQQLESTPEWDICIIGGGATGLGTALDAASRGYKTILFEQYDFAKGTSSRSTKLVHGGVRYLQQGNIKLVMEALRERGLLLQNAPHLVHNQKFVVPNYSWWEKTFYGVGLKVYDMMAGKLGLGPSRFLSKEETLEFAPTLDPEDLKGGILYHDGQFDDARLAISIAQTAAGYGAVLLNYFPVAGLLKLQKKIGGVWVKDSMTGKEYEVKSKVVINATGVFTDSIMRMDDAKHENIINPSQGIHLVVDKEFLPGDTAIMIPRTDDGRVLFAVPWHDKIVLGTTDTPADNISSEPIPLQDEIDFILKHMGRYLSKDPQLSDVRSMFAGLRPLVKGKTKKTAALSRDHFINIGDSGLLTITGGKWTTYRKMAEDVVDIAMRNYELPEKFCKTKELKLNGYNEPVTPAEITSLSPEELKTIIKKSVEEEMCMTVEDFLSRRTRQLLLNAQEAINAAPLIAKLMADEMNNDAPDSYRGWIKEQINTFNAIAINYLPTTNKPDSYWEQTKN
ncbi:MAG: glycerol-3-phosphate dehydrogenase/oxidase [Chitinophagaceae bacterium]|nr:glycerol-3-phosphate dehydrogenase/oxidase [Chitinophagaceae bacterium]